MYDATISRYMRLLRETLQQKADHVTAESYKVENKFGETTLSVVLTKNFDPSARHSFRGSWATDLHAGLPEIAHQTELLFGFKTKTASHQQTIDKQVRRARCYACLKTILMANIISKRVRPALQLAVCDDNLF